MASKTDEKSRSQKMEAIEQKLREWWRERNEDWETDTEDGSRCEEDVWNHMPEIDSKEVARAGHIIGDHLDTEFDPTMIPPGGYNSIDVLTDDLISKMLDKEGTTD